MASTHPTYRFHVLGLVHLPCSKQYLSCAFTQKNHKLARILLSLGHEVYYYGAEGSDVPCTRFIQTHTLTDLRKDYGEGDNRFDIGYDWTRMNFRHDFGTNRKPSTLKYYANTIAAINSLKKPDDFLLCTMGTYHDIIAKEVNLYLTCEPGIGYLGSVKGRFRAFESAAIQNFMYGSEAPYESISGSYYDRIIPNFFDPEDITFSKQKEDYYLFIGRMMKRKGIIPAQLVTDILGKKLIIAGQGARVDHRGYLTPIENPDFALPPGNWEYIGYADVETRKQLMAHAMATFTPTEYLEPFAGTHIESMLSGTPPITTNFGVFPGTIPDTENGKVGFRCNTLQDFVEAATQARQVDHTYIRKYAERFLMENVKWEYQRWFDDLYHLYESTISPQNKGWSWLKTDEVSSQQRLCGKNEEETF
jgi:glycosyltransferase involved in cell wall biosynthesis